MSTDDRMPWWYSGDEPAPHSVDGDLGSPDEPVAAGEPVDRGTGLDWSVLLSGAQRLADWATDAVLAPHAEHSDPRAHAQCLLCRASLLFGDGARGDAASDAPQTAPGAPVAGSGIRWLPIRE